MLFIILFFMVHESAVVWLFFRLCFVAQSSHIPMIDALMMAYTVEMISIEKVVTCVKRFSTFSASKELPFDLEDAMVFWINKVCLIEGFGFLVKSCLSSPEGGLSVLGQISSMETSANTFKRRLQKQMFIMNSFKCIIAIPSLCCRWTWKWGRSQRRSTNQSSICWNLQAIRRYQIPQNVFNS